MKFIKYSFAAFLLTFFSSCLKSKNDLAGLKNDKGSIVTSIIEAQHHNTDAQNIGYHFAYFTNFSFTQPAATEQVKFFTLHVSQPRENKISGPLVVKISMTPLAGYDAFPAGAVTVPTEISIPASSGVAIDFPVKFAVNKTLLDPAAHYGATFQITSVNQGVYSAFDDHIDIVVNYGAAYNNSRYTGRYIWRTTIQDPANQYNLVGNSKPVVLEENAVDQLDIFDFVAWAFSSNAAYRYIWANNNKTGVNTAIFRPKYNLDASGKVTSITNASNVAANSTSTSAQVLASTAVTNIAIDATGTTAFQYNANDQRSMMVKYSFDLTTTINGAPVTRKVTVTETFTYDPLQAFYE